MYIPEAFKIQDPDRVGKIIDAHNFGVMVSRDTDSFFASHLPFIFQPERSAKGTLISHMAKANRHWQLLNETEKVLVVFNGPHAYISPSYYAAEVAVPTWNYVTVHVQGVARILQTEAELDFVLSETVKKHEAGRAEPWNFNLPGEMRTKLTHAIVGFEIEITDVEGKLKLGQNRSKEDQQKMLRSLSESGEADSVELAKFIEGELGGG